VEREQTNAELEAFSYSVSHDLRAPLRAIEGFTQAFIDDYGAKVDPAGLDYLNEVTAATRRMNRLVLDLLTFSRLSRIQFEMRPVSVAGAVRKAVGELPEGADRVKVDPIPTQMQVTAHEQTLIQVLTNLLGNAVKFHKPGIEPDVEVSAVRLRNCARISVRDNGIGIAPEHQERIFQVFERLHGQEEYPGTGIGLAIVKRGVQRMRGDLGLESAPGQGSTFWVELPEITESK
jgi:signal transduction histidine kinase